MKPTGSSPTTWRGSRGIRTWRGRSYRRPDRRTGGPADRRTGGLAGRWAGGAEALPAHFVADLELRTQHAIRRGRASALDHDVQGHRGGEDVELETFALLLAGPVHE